MQRSLLLPWETAACCCTDLRPTCLGKVCTQSISMEMCFGGLRGKEGTLKPVSGSQLLYLGAILAQAGPARFTLASLFMSSWDTLSGASHSWWCNRCGVPHGGTNQTFMGVLALLSCGCRLLSHVSINTRFYSYLILLTIADF